MFRTLDESTQGQRRRGFAFACGVLAQILVIGAAVFLGLLFPDEIPIGVQRYATVWLAALKPPDKPVLTPPRPMPHTAVPHVKVPRLTAPVEVPTPPVVRQEAPKAAPMVSSVTVHVPLPRPQQPPPTPPPVPHMEVRTGLFGGGAPEPVTTKRPVQQVQTGGFGSPQALPGRSQGDSAGNVPKLGSFGLPQGAGVGNGKGGQHGVQGVVASAGFDSGTAGAGYGRRSGESETPQVAVGGFDQAPPAPRTAAKVQNPLPTHFQPIEILSKPSPVYTEDARRSGIQGDVALSVVFEATGTLRVVGVVKSLGHGLDQAAEQAATQIRFKPARRDGRPADFPATLRIEFRLADQST